MNDNDVKSRLDDLHENTDTLLSHQRRIHLKKVERERNWLIWHDHSGLGNKGFLLFLVREMYDPAVHLTDGELQTKCGLSKKVQSIIEQPRLYMMGMAGSSDADQLAFTSTRRECLRGLNQPVQHNGIDIHDNMRFMNGDNPSVEFEDGTQKGGHLGCPGCDGDIRMADDYEYMSQRRYKSLEEKKRLVLSGVLGKKGGVKPFDKLKVEDLRKELQARGESSDGLKKDLHQRLTDILGGTTKLPALIHSYNNDHTELSDLNLSQYEVLFFEPLHCCLNHIEHILTELPTHISDVETLILLKETISASLNKQKLRCVDYRRALLQLTVRLAMNENVDENVRDLLTTFCEMMHMYYAYEDQRNPRQILRLYNVTLKHSQAFREVLTPPQTMTYRKMFGIYYHQIIDHAPFTYRLVCLRSINAELFERFFDRIEDITRKTWSKRSEDLIPNAFLHIQGEESQEEDQDVVVNQERELSKIAKHLSKPQNSIFKKSFLLKNSRMWQAHVKKISDYIDVDKGWWKWHDDGSIEFFDGTDEPTTRPCGPNLYPFRSNSIKSIQKHLDDTWDECIKKPEDLPLFKLIDVEGKVVFKRNVESVTATEDDMECRNGNYCICIVQCQV